MRKMEKVLKKKKKEEEERTREAPQPKTPPLPHPLPPTHPPPQHLLTTTPKALPKKTPEQKARPQPKGTPAVKAMPKYVPPQPPRPRTTTTTTTTTTIKTTTTTRPTNSVPLGVIRHIVSNLNFRIFCGLVSSFVFCLVSFLYVYTNQGEEEGDGGKEDEVKKQLVSISIFYTKQNPKNPLNPKPSKAKCLTPAPRISFRTDG